MFGIRMVGTMNQTLLTIRNANMFGIRAPTVNGKWLGHGSIQVILVSTIWQTFRVYVPNHLCKGVLEVRIFNFSITVGIWLPETYTLDAASICGCALCLPHSHFCTIIFSCSLTLKEIVSIHCVSLLNLLATINLYYWTCPITECLLYLNVQNSNS